MQYSGDKGARSSSFSCAIRIARNGPALDRDRKPRKKKPRLYGACLLLGGARFQEVTTIMPSGANIIKLPEYRYRRFSRGGAIRHGI